MSACSRLEKSHDHPERRGTFAYEILLMAVQLKKYKYKGQELCNDFYEVPDPFHFLFFTNSLQTCILKKAYDK